MRIGCFKRALPAALFLAALLLVVLAFGPTLMLVLGSPGSQTFSNPSFELPGSSDVAPTDWNGVLIGLETGPYNWDFITENLSSQYPPESEVIPNGDFCVELWYQSGTFNGVGGIGGEQTFDKFSTIVDHTNVWVLEYYLESDLHANPYNVRWGGGVVEIEFTSGGSAYKLRYYHECPLFDYSSTPTDSSTVKYIIGERMAGHDWISASHVINADILSKFGFTEFTVDAIRIEDLQDQKGGGWGNMTIYWDNVVLINVSEENVMVSISPRENIAWRGENVEFIITVTNIGESTDTYDISAEDDLGWGLEISSSSLTLAPLFSATATLSVTIPENASPSIMDNISITATSRTDPSVNNSAEAVVAVWDYSRATIPYYELISSVTSIVDGDTILVWVENIVVGLDPSGQVYENTSEYVRFGGGIDAPEYYEPGYNEATEFIENLIPIGTTVYLDLDNLAMSPTGRRYRGKYERLIAVIYVKLDGQWVNVNAELLRWGLKAFPGNDWLQYDYTESEFDPYKWLKDNYPYVQDYFTFTLDLVAGWNLVGFSGIGADDKPSNIFTGLTYYVDYSIYYWDAPGGPYGLQGPDEVLEDNLGYWVWINQDTTVMTSSMPPDNRDIYLENGWNLVNFPVVNENTTPNNVFTGLSYYTDYYIYYWSAPGGPYGLQGPDQVFEDDLGYWVWIDRDNVVTVP